MNAKIFFLMTVLFAAMWSMPKVHAEELARIAVASNFLIPMKALLKEYQAESGKQIRISAGSTGKLYAQIIHGAPFDIFFAADSQTPQKLEKEGYTVPGTRTTYAIGRLALWSKDDRLLSKNPAATLTSAKVKRIALANPSVAPYGVAALSTLSQLKLENQLKSKLIRAENVSQAYQYVATGNVEVGFVAYSQLISNQNAKGVWVIPSEYHKPISQQSVLLKRASANQTAIEFLNYLKQWRAEKLIRSYGYELADSKEYHG